MQRHDQNRRKGKIDEGNYKGNTVRRKWGKLDERKNIYKRKTKDRLLRRKMCQKVGMMMRLWDQEREKKKNIWE